MSFRKSENFRTPNFCEGCPPVEGMEQIEVRLSNNEGPGLSAYWAHAKPADKVLYAHDPTDEESAAIVLGRDYITDPFCGCCETSNSANLGRAHQKIDRCEGPVEVSSWFGFKKMLVCGAGFTDDRKYVNAVNKLGKEYSNLVTVVEVQPRRHREDGLTPE